MNKESEMRKQEKTLQDYNKSMRSKPHYKRMCDQLKATTEEELQTKLIET